MALRHDHGKRDVLRHRQLCILTQDLHPDTLQNQNEITLLILARVVHLATQDLIFALKVLYFNTLLYLVSMFGGQVLFFTEIILSNAYMHGTGATTLPMLLYRRYAIDAIRY